MSDFPRRKPIARWDHKDPELDAGHRATYHLRGAKHINCLTCGQPLRYVWLLPEPAMGPHGPRQGPS